MVGATVAMLRRQGTLVVGVYVGPQEHLARLEAIFGAADTLPVAQMHEVPQALVGCSSERRPRDNLGCAEPTPCGQGHDPAVIVPWCPRTPACSRRCRARWTAGVFRFQGGAARAWSARHAAARTGGEAHRDRCRAGSSCPCTPATQYFSQTVSWSFRRPLLCYNGSWTGVSVQTGTPWGRCGAVWSDVERCGKEVGSMP